MKIQVDTAVTLPVNVAPLTDDTDFKTRETGLTYDQAGMDLVWNFCTTAGVVTQTAITPTTGGNYDWAHVGDGMYKIGMPASGGASANNDTEGTGWFTGYATGVLPWASPLFEFSTANVVNALVNGTDYLQVDAVEISGDSTAANNAELAFDGTGYGFTNCTMPTVTTLTGHTVQTGDTFVRLGAPAGASVSADVAAIKTDTGNLVTRITATLFTGITSLAQWLGLLAGKQVGDTTARTELRATGAGSGTFDETTDSTEAIRDTAPLGTAMRGTDGAYTGTPPTADAIGTDAASKVLATPANKLATDASGNVAANNMRGTDSAALAATALSTVTWTAARAAYIDKLNVSGTLAHSDAAATYKADVSALALEATLTGMKGATWSAATDTLEAIRDKLPANLEDLNITDTTGMVRPDMANAAGNYSGTVATVTTLTNAPTDMATESNQTTILNRLGAFTGTGVNTVLGFFKALLSKTATLPTDVGGTFDPAADSTEAIRDRGDAAWITAAGTSTVTTTDIENIVIETGVTLKQALQRVGAVAAGKVSGAGTGTEVFVGMDGTTTRVTVTVDSSGNRSAITYA